jgi:hypothetical protein
MKRRIRPRCRRGFELLRAFTLLYLFGSAMLYGSRALKQAGAPPVGPRPQLTVAE